MRTEPFPLQQLKPLSKGGSALAKAAQSIALKAGKLDTIVDILHGRAFRYYSEALRQYLAIRLGTVLEAEEALAKVRAFAASSDTDSLVQTPGIRARLYQAAYRLVHDRKRTPNATEREALPWRCSPSHNLSSNPLLALRFELNEAESEILELRYARELNLEELALVYDQDQSVVQSKLDQATSNAKSLLGEHGFVDEERFPRVVVEAFALQPRTLTDTGAEADIVEPLTRGTVIGGRYAVEARVGTGAFGDVYRAKDTEVPGHVVALKLLHQPAHSESARETSLRELRIIASVFHPSIVQFKDHGWFDKRLWFVMPWYDGETLESRLQREPLSRTEARRIFDPLARALAAMHAAGIRHQDVKPENIFLARIPGFGEEEVLPVLLDLGVAATDAEMVVAGTPTYFAPEVAAQFASVEDKPIVTSRADVFALALSLRNALEPETQEDVAAGAIESFIEMRAREAPDLPEASELNFLDPWFEKCLSLNPNQRPTADEFAEELAILTRPEERREKRRSLLQWLLPILIAIMTASGSAIAIFQQQATEQRREAERARLAEADMRQDLEDTIESAEILHQRFVKSQMTRTQLATELGRTDQRLRRSQRKLREETNKLGKTRSTLQETRTLKQNLETELAATETALQHEESNVRQLEGELSVANDDLTQRRLEIDELQASATALRNRIRTQAAKARRLRASLKESEQIREAKDSEITELKAQIRALKQELRDQEHKMSTPPPPDLAAE